MYQFILLISVYVLAIEALKAIAVISAVLIILSQVALWQRKEYRLDRMRAYVFSPEGYFLKQKGILISGIFLFLAWVWFATHEMIITTELLAAISLLIIFISHTIRIARKGLVRPDFTPRAILVFGCIFVLGTIWIGLLIPLYELLILHLATFIFFLPVLVALSVYIVSIPAQMQKQSLISRATELRKHLKYLTVIGITGSVGKTSTKTYLIHLLGGESETLLATSEHRNSPYSVAQDMLSRLSQKTRIYIAEMGAYVQGEIAELAHITKPNIGIITAIKNQHVALFGSLEALAQTKWELVQALPENGIAILNKDDAQIALHAKGLKKKTIWFSLHTHADVSASSIAIHQTYTACTISLGEEAHVVTLPIISRGQMVPVLAAVAATRALGTDTASIIERLKTLPRLPRTMELLSGISHATIVDDSYSASEASVANAIEYLANLSSKDIRLVMVPVIELGTEGSDVHERIGKLLAPLSARVYIYGDAYKEDLLRGLGRKPKATVTWYADASSMKKEVLAGVAAKTVMVLEGRIPNIVRKAVIPGLTRDPGDVDSRIRGNDKKL